MVKKSLPEKIEITSHCIPTISVLAPCANSEFHLSPDSRQPTDIAPQVRMLPFFATRCPCVRTSLSGGAGGFLLRTENLSLWAARLGGEGEGILKWCYHSMELTLYKKDRSHDEHQQRVYLGSNLSLFLSLQFKIYAALWAEFTVGLDATLTSPSVWGCGASRLRTNVEY